MAEKTTRQRVRSWIRDRIADESSVEIPALYREMVTHFAADPEFVTLWLAETLPAVAYEETRSVCAATRGPILWGDRILSRVESDERLRQVRPRWQVWLEHVGDRHVRLMDMTAADLASAERIRRERGENELRIAELWAELRTHLRGRKRVGDVFTAEQIDDLAAAMNVAVTVNRQIVIREDLAA